MIPTIFTEKQHIIQILSVPGSYWTGLMCLICTIVAQRFFQYIFENTAVFKFKDGLDLLYLKIRVGNMQISMAFAYLFFAAFFLTSETGDSPCGQGC